MAKTTTPDATSKKLDAADEDEDTFYYIGVKASPFASDCSVFGLPPTEGSALRSRFPLSASSPNVVNGIMLKGPNLSLTFLNTVVTTYRWFCDRLRVSKLG